MEHIQHKVRVVQVKNYIQSKWHKETAKGTDFVFVTAGAATYLIAIVLNLR